MPDEGVEQHSQTVRGNNGILATSATGTVQTNNYTDGGSIEATGTGDYPLTVNPSALMQELLVFNIGDSIELDITTSDGSTISNVKPNGTLLTLDTVEMDSITFRDPTSSGATLNAMWVGE